MIPEKSSGVSVEFFQENEISPLEITVKVYGATAIHEFGDILSGFDAAGAHYNPLNKNHPTQQKDTLVISAM